MLYEHRQQPVDHPSRPARSIGPGAGVQQHLDRRLRDLDQHFLIERARADGQIGLRPRRAAGCPPGTPGSISKKLRAWVLRDQRCAQCGRTPTEHGVKLHVDHKIPQRWGGDDSPDNLQALCSECRDGRESGSGTTTQPSMTRHPEILDKASTYDEPHVRIGEALEGRLSAAGAARATCWSALRQPSSTRPRPAEAPPGTPAPRPGRSRRGRRNQQGRAVACYRLTEPAPSSASRQRPRGYPRRGERPRGTRPRRGVGGEPRPCRAAAAAAGSVPPRWRRLPLPPPPPDHRVPRTAARASHAVPRARPGPASRWTLRAIFGNQYPAFLPPCRTPCSGQPCQ